MKVKLVQLWLEDCGTGSCRCMFREGIRATRGLPTVVGNKWKRNGTDWRLEIKSEVRCSQAWLDQCIKHKTRGDGPSNDTRLDFGA